MTADVELLPLPNGFRDPNLAGPVYRAAHLHAYARACVAHATAAKDAEIEALRAEVERWKQTSVTNMLDWSREMHRAERLAEALDIIARVGKASRNQTTRTRWIVARAVSALNDDEDWQALPKPKGFHDALLNHTAAQENDDE